MNLLKIFHPTMGITDANDLPFYLIFLICFITALLIHCFIQKYLKPFNNPISHPPSPPALPIIGHLHLVGKVLPVSFQTLARRHGPLMQLRLGASKCVIVSNAEVAKEVLKTQEFKFCSRPEFSGSEYFIYRGSRFILAPYGDYWRFMKKLCMTNLLAIPRLHKLEEIREEEKVKLVDAVMKCCREGKPCDLGSELSNFTNNSICRMAMGTRCSGTRNEAKEIKEIVKACMEVAGKVSVGDILGPLKIFDFSRNGKKLMSVLLKFDSILDRIISEHEGKAMKGNFGSDQRKDLKDTLLEIYKDPSAEIKLTKKDIKSFLLDILMAGTDTTSASIQWTMGELINHPQVLKKLREEINSVVGPDRIVNESDIPNLPYLQALIKETLRLHLTRPNPRITVHRIRALLRK